MSPTDLDRTPAAVLAMAERQHALVTHGQCLSLGATRHQWTHMLDSGGWMRVTRRVLRRTGSAPTDAQRALAAVLDVGPSAYLSHRSAAALWGFPGFRVEPLELIVVRARRTPSPLATIHHPRHLPDPFAAILDGVSVVRPALVLLQLAPIVHPEKLRRLLNWFWARRLLSARSALRELDPVMHRGRAGTVALRDLLEGLPADYEPPASGLEDRFARILAEAGLPPMRRQVNLGDQERWCGRVDYVAVDLPLVVEVDSELFHSALSDLEDDAVRQESLERAGFVVARVDEHNVWHHKDRVVATVRHARLAARRLQQKLDRARTGEDLTGHGRRDRHQYGGSSELVKI